MITRIQGKKQWRLVESKALDACDKCALRQPALPECPIFFCEEKGQGYWEEVTKEKETK